MSATAKSHANLRDIIRCLATQTDTGLLRIAKAFEKCSNLYPFDIAQHPRATVIHIWCQTCLSNCLIGCVRPDQTSVASSLDIGNNSCVITNLSQWMRAEYGFDNLFWGSSC